MIELIMLFYVIPKRLYPAARAARKNGVAWSVIGGVVFLFAEMLVGFCVAMIYAIVAMVTGLPFEMNGGLQLLLYIPSVICGFVSLGLVQKYLTRQQTTPFVPPPPAPPRFDEEKAGPKAGDRDESNSGLSMSQL